MTYLRMFALALAVAAMSACGGSTPEAAEATALPEPAEADDDLGMPGDDDEAETDDEGIHLDDSDDVPAAAPPDMEEDEGVETGAGAVDDM